LVTERSHLSIGEVLSLLREEFPDVTISKIRFLESQGLVDPERTPSGYRKFYDHDVERLRWILRQQRENFLPLKIIRGRLTEQGEELDENSSEDGSGDEGDRRVAAGEAPAGAAGSSPAGDGERTIEDAAVTHPSAGARQPGSLSPGSVPPGAAPPDPAGAPLPVTTAAGPGASPAGTGRSTDPAGPGERGGRVNSGAAGSERPPAGGQSGSPSRPTSGRPATGAIAGGPVGAVGRGRSVGPAGLLSPPLDTETYSIEELASASGGTVAMVAELQDYGLISVRTVVGGTPYFDATALAVARAAAGFARHGVDARHLRAWRNSADREAGLFEQVIMPLLRQRNPEARRQAATTLAELTSLGGDLRMALIDQAVRQIH
jgi:DNA-binding transcriptional MerR regulator